MEGDLGGVIGSRGQVELRAPEGERGRKGLDSIEEAAAHSQAGTGLLGESTRFMIAGRWVEAGRRPASERSFIGSARFEADRWFDACARFGRGPRFSGGQ